MSELNDLQNRGKNQSENSSADLIEFLPVAVYRAEPFPPYAPIYISPAIEMFGYSISEWFTRPDLWSSIIYPADRERILRETKAAFAAGADNQYEYRIVAKDGAIHWIHDRGRFVYQSDGTPVCWQGVLLDITDRKRVEAELRLSEERFRRAVDDASIGMALVAPGGRWLRVNRALCRIVGYSEAELLAVSFQAITHPEDLNVDLEYVGRLLAGEIETYQMEKRYFHKSGQIIWVLLNVSLVRDSQNAPLYFISQIQDVTERRQAEQSLRESREQYKQMVDHASDIIYKTDADGRFIFVNPTIIKILQYTERELFDRHYLEIVRPDLQRAVRRFYTRQLIKKIPNTYYETVALAKDGGEIWLGQYVQLTSEDDRITGFQAIARDITSRKKTEEELRNLSLTDELTGLYNRRGFFALAEHQLKLALNKRNEKKLLAIYVDLDKLKQINDTFGHEAGSQAIVGAANVLKHSFRQSDIVARLGGDEFVVLAIEAEEENTAMMVSRLEKNLNIYNERRAQPYELSLSLGISRYDAKVDSGIETLINRADQEMYKQKNNKNRR